MALPRRKATGFRAFPPGGLPTLAAQTPLRGLNEYGPSEAIPAVLCSFGPKSLSFSAQTTALASFLIFFARPLWTITEKDLHIVRTLPKVLIFTRTPPFAAALSPLGGGSAKQKEVFLRRIQICPRS